MVGWLEWIADMHRRGGRRRKSARIWLDFGLQERRPRLFLRAASCLVWPGWVEVRDAQRARRSRRRGEPRPRPGWPGSRRRSPPRAGWPGSRRRSPALPDGTAAVSRWASRLPLPHRSLSSGRAAAGPRRHSSALRGRAVGAPPSGSRTRRSSRRRTRRRDRVPPGARSSRSIAIARSDLLGPSHVARALDQLDADRSRADVTPSTTAAGWRPASTVASTAAPRRRRSLPRRDPVESHVATPRSCEPKRLRRSSRRAPRAPSGRGRHLDRA